MSRRYFGSLVLSCASLLAGSVAITSQAAETQVPVTFTGGYETDRQDGGRPVVLVAGALGVKPEVFREAFRGVKPARGGPPSGEEARRNKQSLMKVLAPHGITNDRLDEVSNYYRYRPQNGEMWPTKPAKAYAVVEGGQIKKIVITEGGSGYSSPPQASVKGFANANIQVTLGFDEAFDKNGAIKSMEVAPAKPAPKPAKR